jgi:hypothetical protein
MEIRTVHKHDVEIIAEHNLPNENVHILHTGRRGERHQDTTQHEAWRADARTTVTSYTAYAQTAG